MVERENRPHLPTAQALVVVACQILRRSEQHFSPAQVDRFDEVADILRKTLDDCLREERLKMFGGTKKEVDEMLAKVKSISQADTSTARCETDQEKFARAAQKLSRRKL